jgi:hypothetical protein
MRNEQRAIRFEMILLSLREEYGDEPGTVLIDLLTDAMHWGRAQGRDFAAILDTAEIHFQTEIIEETGVWP